MYLEYVDKFYNVLVKAAPYMESNLPRLKETFGETWEQRFNEMLKNVFGNNSEKLENAVKGYVRFALDATRLQKRFEKERQYVAKTYEEAAKAVYHNEEYMENLYLPGILLSHYLWPHHYRSLQYFHEEFIPYVLKSEDKTFCEIGVGTGFYSRQMLSASSEITGIGLDISNHSLKYAKMQVEAFGYADRWSEYNRNVLTDPLEQKFQFVLSVEILEHLEDPLSMLKGIKNSLAENGKAYIVAALTAPNEDHIYLYNNEQEVIDQLLEVGFKVIDHNCEKAYESKGSDLIPQLAAFIVSK